MSNAQKPKSVFDQLADNNPPTVDGHVEGAAAAAHSAAQAATVASTTFAAPTASAVKTAQAAVSAGIPAAAPIGAGNADAATLNTLLQYLIMKEGREAAAAQASEERFKAIRQQRFKNARESDSKIMLKQAKCKHLKGGKKGPKTQNKDYAVYQHTFISFMDYIRCRICGMKWFREDTVDYLVRTDKHGKKVKISNHTHKGWREAVEMCDASTDTRSASEALPNVAPNATNLDAAGLAFETRLVNKDTGELVEGISI